MTAPQGRDGHAEGDNGDEWQDEWNHDDWQALDMADRAQRNEDSWVSWALRLLAVALVLPLVLGLLVLILILIF